MPTTDEANRRQLQVLSDFAGKDGGILTNVVQFKDPSKSPDHARHHQAGQLRPALVAAGEHH